MLMIRRQFALKIAMILGASVMTDLAPSGALAQSLHFSDQTSPAGVACAHAMDLSNFGTQSMAAGGAAGDFDNDGWQDLFVLGGWGNPDKLFINNRNGTFTERGAASGVARIHRGMGIAVGDFDADGWLDIFISSEPYPGGPTTNVLYHNNHNGTFTDVAIAAGVAFAPGMAVGGGWGAAWGDYDLDGWLDLAVADWTRSPGGNRVYHNNGNGTFTNVTTTALNPAWMDVQGFSPRFVDMNGDRFPELLWVSDFGQSRYFVNNGNGSFSNATAGSGVGLDGNGMGTAVADFNGDGRPDWFVTSIYNTTPYPNQPGTGNMLYMNQGAHQFSEVSQSSGVKRGGWGWGAIAEDMDNDGLVDIAHTNGFYYSGPEFDNDPTCVFRNLGTGAFAEAAPACGVTHTGQGRGMVALDYNNDSRMDLVIFTNGGAMALYRNDTTGPGTSGLRVLLSTRASHGLAPNGYGAHLVATVNGAQQHRWITGGSNYLSQSELSAHFGLGTATEVQQLRVEWPDGTVTLRSHIVANQTMTISSCPGDWNADGALSVQDIFDYLNEWFGGGGDFDGGGQTTVQDIFDYLNSWFSGC